MICENCGKLRAEVETGTTVWSEIGPGRHGRNKLVKSERCQSWRTKLGKQAEDFKWVTALCIGLTNVAEWACGLELGAFLLQGEAPDLCKADWAGGMHNADSSTRARRRMGALPEHQRCQWVVQKTSRSWSSASLAGTWLARSPHAVLQMPLT